MMIIILNKFADKNKIEKNRKYGRIYYNKKVNIEFSMNIEGDKYAISNITGGIRRRIIK